MNYSTSSGPSHDLDDRMRDVKRVILATGSPRRKAILSMMGVEYTAIESGFDEELVKTDDPVELVEDLALQKALHVGKNYSDAIVVGGDTTVVVGNESLAKANTPDEAAEMLGKLSNTTHRVVTGVAVVDTLTGEKAVGSESGWVTFREVAPEEVKKYVSDERNWRGFAGAYAIQGGATQFVAGQTGKLSAIIGFPVELVGELLEQMGVIVEVDTKEVEMALGQTPIINEE